MNNYCGNFDPCNNCCDTCCPIVCNKGATGATGTHKKER